MYIRNGHHQHYLCILLDTTLRRLYVTSTVLIIVWSCSTCWGIMHDRSCWNKPYPTDNMNFVFNHTSELWSLTLWHLASYQEPWIFFVTFLVKWTTSIISSPLELNVWTSANQPSVVYKNLFIAKVKIIICVLVVVNMMSHFLC